jgi:hypothetical protein
MTAPEPGERSKLAQLRQFEASFWIRRKARTNEVKELSPESVRFDV